MCYSVKGGKNLDGIFFCAIFKYVSKQKIVQSSSKQAYSFNAFKAVS